MSRQSRQSESISLALINDAFYGLCNGNLCYFNKVPLASQAVSVKQKRTTSPNSPLPRYEGTTVRMLRAILLEAVSSRLRFFSRGQAIYFGWGRPRGCG